MKPGLSVGTLVSCHSDPQSGKLPESLSTSTPPFSSHRSQVPRPDMKLLTILILTSLLPGALSGQLSGAYQRLWVWFCYNEDTGGNYIATGCRGSAAGGRCTFPELMKYIAPYPNKVRPLRDDIDPNRIYATVTRIWTLLLWSTIAKHFQVRSLMMAKYGGRIDAGKCIASLRPNQFIQLMQKLNEFMLLELFPTKDGTKEATKKNIQTVSRRKRV